MTVYSDSLYTDDKRTGRSTMGQFIQFGVAHYIGNHSCRRQQASAQLKLNVAVAYAYKKAYSLRHLLQGVGITSYNTPKIHVYTDNQVAATLITNNGSTSSTRRINVLYHYIRDLYQAGNINIAYIPCGKQLADLLIQSLVSPAFGKCI